MPVGLVSRPEVKRSVSSRCTVARSATIAVGASRHKLTGEDGKPLVTSAQVKSNNGAAMPMFIYGTARKKSDTAGLTELALDVGLRELDTANQLKHYDEALVGEALKRRRESSGSRCSCRPNSPHLMDRMTACLTTVLSAAQEKKPIPEIRYLV